MSTPFPLYTLAHLLAVLHAPRSFQSDTEALENAQREAEGLPPLPSKARHNKPGGGQATDEAVMERFKKVSRKWDGEMRRVGCGTDSLAQILYRQRMRK